MQWKRRTEDDLFSIACKVGHTIFVGVSTMASGFSDLSLNPLQKGNAVRRVVITAIVGKCSTDPTKF
jgi:hypothetical protein